MSDIFVGFTAITYKDLIMIAIGITLIYLAIKKEYEPMLLLPIGFGILVTNLPLSVVIEHEGVSGFLKILFDAGITNDLFPVLIFIAVGAMVDFTPLFKMPVLIFYGAAAQFGIFTTIIFAVLIGFDLKTAASIGIIGAADGPTAIYVASKFAKDYLGAISVAAYSYMALVPLIQPPIIKMLTSSKERKIRMKYSDHEIPQVVKIIFPIAVTLISGFIAPISVPLVGSLMFGNLIRESKVIDRLSKAAQNELANIVTLLLGITIGSTMNPGTFLQTKTLLIFIMGLLAFAFDTAGGVLFAKLINLFLHQDKKINPMIGAAGISAFPMAARVINKIAQDEDPKTVILMQSVSANVSGQLGSIIAGGLVLALIPLLIK